MNVDNIRKITDTAIHKCDNNKESINFIYSELNGKNNLNIKLDYVNGYPSVIISSELMMYKDDRDIAIVPCINEDIKSIDKFYKIITVETI